MSSTNPNSPDDPTSATKSRTVSSRTQFIVFLVFLTVIGLVLAFRPGFFGQFLHIVAPQEEQSETYVMAKGTVQNQLASYQLSVGSPTSRNVETIDGVTTEEIECSFSGNALSRGKVYATGTNASGEWVLTSLLVEFDRGETIDLLYEIKVIEANREAANKRAIEAQSAAPAENGGATIPAE